MARLVVKIKYMKSGGGGKAGGYAKYIGTREGVAKIDDSQQYSEASWKQKELINRLITDFPDLKTSPEYKDYVEKPTKGLATELIERALEESFAEDVDPKTYADYIATRPRAERIGTHGLFTDEGIDVNLEEVSRNLNQFEGTIWTAIVSLRQEEAQQLGFDTGKQWRDIIRKNKLALAEAFKIKPDSFQWYGAFHNESYHPHIHMIIYDKSNRGFLDKDGMERIKSIFAHVIFQDEMFTLEQSKSDSRDALRTRSRDEIEEIVARIHDGSNENVMLQAMLLDLSRRLKEHKGKKKYSYLKPPDKKLVDSIVDEIGKIPAVKALYELWFEKQEALSSIYKTEMPPRLPLSANPAFKTIRNAVISAADELGLPKVETAAKEEVGEDFEEKEVIDIGAPWKEDHSPTHERISNSRQNQVKKTNEAGKVALTVTRLLNNIGKIFRDQFTDYPQHRAKVDKKIWQKIREKEEAHGMKMG